jgi:predicted DNA-binding transcriptional regulator AlpA
MTDERGSENAASKEIHQRPDSGHRSPNLQQENDILLTPKQAAQVLATPEGTLKRWRAEGRGPAWVKLEGSVRYTLSDVQQYIESNRHLPSVRTFMEGKNGSL